MAQNDDLEEGEYIPEGGSNMKIAVVAVIALLIGAGAGYAGNMFIGGAEAAAEDVEDGAEGEDGVAGESGDDRLVVALNPFVVNLRGSGGGRVLRLEVQLEVNASDRERIEKGTPRMRDALLSLASDYSYTELEGIDGKMHFRDELLGRLNRVLEGPSIQRIYFTEFVVQ
jgi:flagellar basal body-associated protein FliL